ncbi:MAG: hypothetical protein LJE96_18085, partial [Deltaproteobacteria bacterium]|nr:hypothetical protein [Deltaproteobacteria bacterium]
MSLGSRYIENAFCVLFILFTLLFSPFGVAFASPRKQPENPLEDKKILVLNAFEANIPAFEKTDHGLSVALQSGGIAIANQFYEHLDLRRNPGPEHHKLTLELLRKRYGGKKIDLIITLYPETLNFLLDECETIFPDVPVLALYLPQGFTLPKTNRKIVQHVVIPDFKPTITAALQLIPDLKRIDVVGGTYPVDKWLENVFRKESENWKHRLAFRYLSDLPLEEILSKAAHAPSDSILFITAFGRDINGKPHTAVEVSRILAPVSSVPIFGFLGTLLGNGIVGGSLLS